MYLFPSTVEENGKISNIKIQKSLSKSCDKEALRLVKNMPDWIPAKRNGKRIPADAMVSVPFELSR